MLVIYNQLVSLISCCKYKEGRNWCISLYLSQYCDSISPSQLC